MKQCPYCGVELSDESLFCTECGKELPKGNVCPHCGALVNEGDVFCMECGKAISEKPTSIAFKEVKDETPPPPKKKPCPYCGYLMDENDVSCDNCGRLVVEGFEEEQESGNNTLKKYLPYIVGIILALVLGGFWLYDRHRNAASHKHVVADSLEIARQDSIQNAESLQLIKEWYEYVLGGSPTEKDMQKFLSYDLMRKIWTDDYDGTYEFWRFRTSAQDSKPGNDVSKVEEIKSEGGGWYTILYLDMGWKGRTKVKVTDGKIVDMVQDYSWKSSGKEDGEETTDESTLETNEGTEGSNNPSSSSSEESYSKESLIFSNPQYIIGHLLNQRFRHSTGLEIRFDGSGRMYIDGDAAGVISVLRYDSQSAILRYGNGVYGEGTLFMQYANGKIQLTDNADGSVFYQK